MKHIFSPFTLVALLFSNRAGSQTQSIGEGKKARIICYSFSDGAVNGSNPDTQRWLKGIEVLS